VGVEQTQWARVTRCESWRVSLDRAPVVGEGKGPVCIRVGWSFEVGGWPHTLFGCARTSVCAQISASGCVVWDFAHKNGAGNVFSWFGVDVRVNSGTLGWFRVVVSNAKDQHLADGFGCVCFKGGFGSVSGWVVQEDEALCDVLWWGDGRGGVFNPFSVLCPSPLLPVFPPLLNASPAVLLHPAERSTDRCFCGS